MSQGRGATQVKPEKVEFVKAIEEKLGRTRALILTDYRGMTVKEITEFRKSIRKEKGAYQVVKNRLFLRGLHAGKENVEPISDGPLAVLTAEGDPYNVLKLLYKFVKEIEKPVVKGGFLDNNFFGEGDLKKLSRLPSREELLAMVAGGALAPLSGCVGVLQGVLRKFVYALAEVQKKKEVSSQ